MMGNNKYIVYVVVFLFYMILYMSEVDWVLFYIACSFGISGLA